MIIAMESLGRIYTTDSGSHHPTLIARNVLRRRKHVNPRRVLGATRIADTGMRTVLADVQWSHAHALPRPPVHISATIIYVRDMHKLLINTPLREARRRDDETIEHAPCIRE